ncbi:LOW QUALITY PROTEIN: hypothetical protein HZS_3936 [Henneguya salminicola]|nr:LOW QUALITY PROTEIN: hypothetical protein HZS_3936 [Henneguya salminicola]
MLGYFWLINQKTKKGLHSQDTPKILCQNIKKSLKTLVIVYILSIYTSEDFESRSKSMSLKPKVKRTPERKFLLEEIPDRTEAILKPIICSHELPGSIVITDCFCNYYNLDYYNTHQMVKYCITFRDPVIIFPPIQLNDHGMLLNTKLLVGVGQIFSMKKEISLNIFLMTPRRTRDV